MAKPECTTCLSQLKENPVWIRAQAGNEDAQEDMYRSLMKQCVETQGCAVISSLLSGDALMPGE